MNHHQPDINIDNNVINLMAGFAQPSPATIIPVPDMMASFVAPSINGNNSNMMAPSSSFATPASAAAIAVDIRYWMKTADGLLSSSSPSSDVNSRAINTNNAYVKDAVELAWMLTKHIKERLSTSELALADIVVDNVIIFVEHPSNIQRQQSFEGGTGCRLKIREVRLQNTMFPYQAYHQQGPLSPRAVCAALGNIMLELFSKGRSSSPEEASPDTSSNYHGASSCDGPQEHSSHRHELSEDMHPPERQRRRVSSAPEPEDDSMSKMVNSLLLSVGMPTSIRQFVCDLLDSIDEPCPFSALTSLEEVLWDLTQMKELPDKFLWDRTCPARALRDTHLFQTAEQEELFGRDKEFGMLMNCQRNVTNYMKRGWYARQDGDGQIMMNGMDEQQQFSTASTAACTGEIGHLCEATFLSGYAGSGKSSLMRSLMRVCKSEGWFIVSCKFEKQLTPIKSVAKGFDDFFGFWASAAEELNCKMGSSNRARDFNGNSSNTNVDPAMIESFHRVCRCVSSTIDNEGLSLLYETIPNLGRVFPDIVKGHINSNNNNTSSIDKVGSATKRRLNLFHVIFKSICSAGRPVLVCHDDIHWAHSMEGLKDFIVNYGNIPSATHMDPDTKEPLCHYLHGVMIVGSFRSNEVGENEGIIKTINTIVQSRAANITSITAGELTHGDITKLTSRKLCMPMRYTIELAGLVLSKTRGNPFFIVQFLKSIIENRMLEFSLESRKWKWDIDVIDMQMISDGVAQLLSTRFKHLPLHLMQTAMVASCFGSQIDDTTVDLLNENRELVRFDMHDALRGAVKEGIIEKAGPIYQFTHDLIQQAIYESILSVNQKLLHKSIGMILLKSAPQNPTIHLLAVEQINKYCKDAILSQEEQSQYSEINASAAEISIAESSFEQARSYIDVGIQMLGPHHWENQYSLSLKLYEMSAQISCINGDIANMSTCLNETISNVKSFEDSLVSSSLLAKLLAASTRFGEAISNCLSILSSLGEDFPEDVTLPMVLNELSVIQTTLATISVNQVKLLPRMTDKSKLNAMKFLSMLCSYSLIAKPLLLPVLSCRMVRLTIEHGFCDDSIVGLVTTGYGLFSFTEDAQLGYRIGKVGELLIEESPNRHALRSRLTHELDGTLKPFIEPVHSTLTLFPDRYNSSILAGDMDAAMLSLIAYNIGILYCGLPLVSLLKSITSCIKRSIKCQNDRVVLLSMSLYQACTRLTGSSSSEVDIKSYHELNQIGATTNNMQLLHFNFINIMIGHFWMRDYIKVDQLLEQHKPLGHKRVLEVVRVFFGGITSLILARQTHQPKYRKMGEEALEKTLAWAQMCQWNFGNMAKLIQAELHYLDGNLELAKVAYEASILSAHRHKYLHYEALANELYGIFLLENRIADEGTKQLQMALKKYKKWGAMKKVEQLQDFMDTVDPSHLRHELKINL